MQIVYSTPGIDACMHTYAHTLYARDTHSSHAGTTMRVDGGQSINPAFWNIPDHNSIPAYGTLPLNAKL